MAEQLTKRIDNLYQQRIKYFLKKDVHDKLEKEIKDCKLTIKKKINEQKKLNFNDDEIQTIQKEIMQIRSSRIKIGQTKINLFKLDIDNIIYKTTLNTPIIVLEIIKKFYPDIYEKMDRMDMIATSDDYGYRGKGIFFVDILFGEKVIVCPETEYDDYGYPPIRFMKEVGVEPFFQNGVSWHNDIKIMNDFVDSFEDHEVKPLKKFEWLDIPEPIRNAYIKSLQE